MSENLREKINRKIQAIRQAERNFGDTLEYYIASQALNDSECRKKWLDKNNKLINSRIYESVDMTKDTFSKMVHTKCQTEKDYRPTKVNVCKIAIALRLDFEHTEELLRLAGYRLSNDIHEGYGYSEDIFDMIFRTYIENNNYSFEQLRDELESYGIMVFDHKFYKKTRYSEENTYGKLL